jgi:hypothetical protein
MIYQVLNRGNGHRRVFRNSGDYDLFERVLAEGLDRYAVDLLTYSLMPNHWHLKDALRVFRWRRTIVSSRCVATSRRTRCGPDW